MPITPLHLGLMAPTFLAVKPKKRTWAALISFTLVNLWIDFGAIHAWLHDQSLPSHNEVWHTMDGALFTALVVSLMGIASWRWVLGAYYGGVSHILLDALVHPEMQPFSDPGNPLYMGGNAMPWISALLVAPTAWLISQIVSGSLGYVRRFREQRAAQSSEQSP